MRTGSRSACALAAEMFAALASIPVTLAPIRAEIEREELKRQAEIERGKSQKIGLHNIEKLWVSLE